MSEESDFTRVVTSKKTVAFRFKRGHRSSSEEPVLQQWNQCDDGSGYWEDVPIVYTDNDKEFNEERI